MAINYFSLELFIILIRFKRLFLTEFICTNFLVHFPDILPNISSIHKAGVQKRKRCLLSLDLVKEFERCVSLYEGWKKGGRLIAQMIMHPFIERSVRYIFQMFTMNNFCFPFCFSLFFFLLLPRSYPRFCDALFMLVPLAPCFFFVQAHERIATISHTRGTNIIQMILCAALNLVGCL